jgi:hypothetical protein
MREYDDVVCVVDGKEVVRGLSHVEVDREDRFVGVRRIPFMSEGEEIRWVIGDSRPHIIKVQSRGYTPQSPWREFPFDQ